MFIELLKVLDLSGLGPFVERVSEVLNNWGLRNLHGNVLNVMDFVLDGILSFFGDLDLEHVHVFLPGFWDVRNLDVSLESIFELNNFSLEGLSFPGCFESFSSSLNSSSLFVCKCSGPQLVVSLIPLGSSKSIILSTNIGKLILESVQVLVVDVDGILLVGEDLHLFEDFTNILPLLDESLSLW